MWQRKLGGAALYGKLALPGSIEASHIHRIYDLLLCQTEAGEQKTTHPLQRYVRYFLYGLPGWKVPYLFQSSEDICTSLPAS